VFCHVRDVTAVMAQLMDGGAAVHGQVFNIGGTEEVAMRDLAALVCEISQSPSEIVSVPYEEAYGPGFEDMMRRVPDTTKVRRLTGWAPRHSLREIVSDVIEHQRAAERRV
jgi:UDP-glucose 4-epimerase